MAEEQQDLNEFKRWDAVGASCFLAVVPAIMYWVFIDHDKLTCAMLGSIAGIAGFVVFVLTLVFPERVVGRIVNMIGSIMAPAYLVLAVILFWNKWGGDKTPPPAPETPTQAVPREQTQPAAAQ